MHLYNVVVNIKYQPYENTIIRLKILYLGIWRNNVIHVKLYICFCIVTQRGFWEGEISTLGFQIFLRRTYSLKNLLATIY